MLFQLSDRNVATLSPDDTVSQAIGIMEKTGLKELVVKDNNKICLVDPHRILRIRKAPKSTKLKSIMFPVPTLSPNSDIIDAVRFIRDTGLDAIPLKNKETVTGIVSEEAIMKEIIKDDQFGDMRASDVMTKSPLFITETDTLSNARQIMLNSNIEHLPVVDGEGRLTGWLHEKDLLKAVMKRDNFPYFDATSQKISEWAAPVRDMMNPKVTTIGPMDTLKSALRKPIQTSCIVVTENDKPVGIITPKDVLDLVELPRTGVYVQISGMQEEDGFDQLEASAEVDRTVRKLAATVDIQRLTVHIKKYSEGGRKKYSIRAKLVTDSDVFVSNEWEWNLIQAMGMAMKALERQVLKRKGKKEQTKRNQGRKRNR